MLAQQYGTRFEWLRPSLFVDELAIHLRQDAERLFSILELAGAWRLHENAEVVGTDETFFEDEKHDQAIRDLFTEKSGVLDDPDDNEVDLASQAYQIWKNATDRDPSLKKLIPELPDVVFSTKPVEQTILSAPESTTNTGQARLPGSQLKPFNPEAETARIHRRLPHWYQEGCTYFVTFRLADSLPQEKLKTWAAERDLWLGLHPRPWSDTDQQEYEERFGERLEAWLDAGYGQCHLGRPDIRPVVEGCLKHFDGQRYDLGDYVIMPNHVHLLICPRPGNALSHILRGMKGVSANQCNKLLGRRGAFWMDESFDHIVRSTPQLEKYQQYIADNPWQAALSPDRYTLRVTPGDVTPAILPAPGASTPPHARTRQAVSGQAGLPASPGVLVYVRTADDNDALAWVDEAGRTVTESQHEILRAAACEPDTPGLPRLPNHHELVRAGVELLATEQRTAGGALGRPSSARRRVYERLKDYADRMRGTLFDIRPLYQAIEAIYARPLQEAARETLNRDLRTGVTDEKLVNLVLALHEEDRLCVHAEDAETREPRLICSLGIRQG